MGRKYLKVNLESEQLVLILGFKDLRTTMEFMVWGEREDWGFLFVFCFVSFLLYMPDPNVHKKIT